MRIPVVGCIVAALLCSQPNPPQIPDTPAATQFGRWLAAVNSGDVETIRKFLVSTGSVGQGGDADGKSGAERLAGLRTRAGGLEIKRTIDSTPSKFTALLKEHNSDQYLEIAFEVDPAPPNRILNAALRPVPAPADLVQGRIAIADLISALQLKLEVDSASGAFSGVVMLAKDGKPIFTSAYGLADRERKLPNRETTCFRLGSMNKMFTATAIMQLVEAGKIQLNETLGKYVADYPNQEVASKVTIHHLLTHTAGVGDFFGPEYAAHRTELRTLQDYIDLFGKRGLDSEPGARYRYDNYGLLLLGVVIERVSGQTYYDYVRDHIFKPAGMNSTASPAEGEGTAGCAIGYTLQGGAQLHPNTSTLPYRGTSAGGGYSTAADLLRFASAILDHKFLSAKNTELLTTGKVVMGGPAKYAYGFADFLIDGVRSFGHNGGAPGMNADLTIYPQNGYVAIVLANLDPPAAQRIAGFIRDRLPK